MFTRTDLTFTSHGTPCKGYLYMPSEAKAPVPCVIMGHGFAAFLFDYRHFGASGGEPRQLLVPSREVEDWLSAIAFVRKLDGIKPDAIALWGTSFGGGLVTVAAARDGNVQAIIAQCPMMDGLASVFEVIRYAGIAQVMKLSAHGALDITRSLLGMSPHYIASAGRPGEVAAMSAADCYDGYLALIPEGVPNQVAARIAATLMTFRPVTEAHKVNCPALIQICEKDTVAPVAAAEKAAKKMNRAEVRRYEMGHFDIYQGEDLEMSVSDQLEFLKKTLQA